MSKKSRFLAQLEETVQQAEALRADPDGGIDISLAELVKQKFAVGMDSFYDDLGLNPNKSTIQNIIGLPDKALRWLIPEIFRDALRLGLRKSPIYPNFIAGEQSVAQLDVTMPSINMSEAKPKEVGIAETITTGDVSFGQKSVKIRKYGRGIKLPYEVIQYVALNLVALYLQDFGVKLGLGIDNLAISTLLNGDQADGSDSIATIGVATPNTLAYRDLLKIWVRLGRMGKNPSVTIAGEDMTIEMLELLTATRLVGTPRTNVIIKSPIPDTTNIYVHGSIPTKTAIIVEKASALIKLNAQPLLVESNKLIHNQTEETYATLTTGFATIYRDSRLALDYSKNVTGFGFPTWMDPSLQENVTFD